MSEREQVWRERIEWQPWSGLTVAEFLPWNLSPDRLSELRNSTAGNSNVNSS